MAGGNAPPVNPGDGISAIIRTTMFGTPQPTGEMITDAFTIGSADYAEYFEWTDGNPNAENRIGYFVELNGDKVQFATNNTTTIGIVSGNPAICGDSAALGWQGTNLRNNLGQYMLRDNYEIPMTPILAKYGAKYTSTSSDLPTIISDIISATRSMLTTKVSESLSQNIAHLRYLGDHSLEGITNENSLVFIELLLHDLSEELKSVTPVKEHIVSPQYDPSKVYIPRSQRKEWSPIGLLGKLYVYDNGTCVVGGRCDCVNGVAVPGTTWPVLTRSATNVIRILYR